MATKNSEAAEILAKEIKTQLKQARDLINQKDHNGALKICEVKNENYSFQFSFIGLFLGSDQKG